MYIKQRDECTVRGEKLLRPARAPSALSVCLGSVQSPVSLCGGSEQLHPGVSNCEANTT